MIMFEAKQLFLDEALLIFHDADAKITLWEAKCCITRTLGVAISCREILVFADVDSGLVSRDKFTEMFEYVLDKEGYMENTLQHKIYDALDVQNKGFVTREDLYKALLKSESPKIAEKHAIEYFAALDELGIEKISVTQVINRIMN